MATHEVNLGIGNSSEEGTTGMFYHAPKGTPLPAYPSEELAAAWNEVGSVTEDGITLNTNRTFNQLKDWAKKIKRLLPAEESGTVGVPVMDTTEESLKTIFGADNVTVTPATSAHGKLISVDIEDGKLPEPEAYLFLMKGGDDMLMVGTTNGYVTQVAEVQFQPNNAITWNGTITADKWRILKDDGQKTS
jgi:hypothetical protein